MNKYTEFVNTNRLIERRNKLGLSIRAMCKILGLKSSSSYYSIEIGRTEPKISHMINISKILKKPVSYFFNFNV